MTDKENGRHPVDSGLAHIAFIMDGNGRWATQRGLPREAGHKAGSEAFRRIVRYCGNIGIKTVTVYAFSTENRKRPRHEVTTIMQLLYQYLGSCADEMMEQGVRFHVIGDKTYFSDRLKKRILSVEQRTENNPKLLNVALNYGGRDELVHAFNGLAERGITKVTEADISSALYTAGCPDPDLIVRTGGEKRISNFLLWQSAYAELYFTDRLWPDMTSDDVDAAVLEFYSRKRRFGGV